MVYSVCLHYSGIESTAKAEFEEYQTQFSMFFELSDAEVFNVMGKNREEILGRKPKLGDYGLKEDYLQENKARKVIGNVRVKTPGSDEFVSFKEGDLLPEGSVVRTKLGSSTVVSIVGMGFLEITENSEVELGSSSSENVKLVNGEVEILVRKGAYLPRPAVGTWNTYINVNKTHFWVSYNDESATTLVGVYEGEVELQYKESGEKLSLVPSDDGPGITIVSSQNGQNKLLSILWQQIHSGNHRFDNNCCGISYLSQKEKID